MLTDRKEREDYMILQQNRRLRWMLTERKERKENMMLLREQEAEMDAHR
jgi:hypothetical protein